MRLILPCPHGYHGEHFILPHWPDRLEVTKCSPAVANNATDAFALLIEGGFTKQLLEALADRGVLTKEPEKDIVGVVLRPVRAARYESAFFPYEERLCPTCGYHSGRHRFDCTDNQGGHDGV